MICQNFTSDDLAAFNLLLELGVKRTAASLACVTRHMRSHREGAETLLMQRARSDLSAHLERMAIDAFPHHEEDWTSGFGAAEEAAANWFLDQEAERSQSTPRSRGAILRTLVRAAKWKGRQ